MSPEILQSLAVAAVPLVAWLLTYALGYAFGRLPKVFIPILAAALGPVASYLLTFAGADSGLHPAVAILAGGAAVALQEFLSQVKKQSLADPERGILPANMADDEMSGGWRVKRFR